MDDHSVAEHRPTFKTKDAERLAAERYGLDVSAGPLPSDRDQNFLLTAADGRRWVMKLSSSAEERSALEAQEAAMRCVAGAGLAVPEVLADQSGGTLSHVDGAAGRRHLLRIVTYVPGVPYAGANPKSERLVRSAGRFMGRASAALDAFDHPGAHRPLRWNLLEAAETIRHRLDLLEPDRRPLVEQAQQRYDEIVAPRLASLRRSIVHNDANDYNLLVDPPEVRDREVAGLIDFGDVVHSITISDLAVTAAYVLLHESDPLSTLLQIVSAYHAEYPLREEETAVLFPLITLRLATSVCVSAEQQAAEPENDYLIISQAPAWCTLEKCTGLHPRLVEYTVRHACGLEPCSASQAVVGWIEEHLHEGVEIIEGASHADIHLDFSVSSSEWSFEDLIVPRRAEGEIARRLAEADPPLAVGRYDEVRPVYRAAPFAEEGEYRSVHIGIDLFSAPGTPVRAPYDGVIYSVSDENEPYGYGPVVVLKHEPPDAPAFFTLYGHLARDSVKALRVGDHISGGSAFAEIGTAEENGGWAPHLHVQVIVDLLERGGAFPGVARASQRDVWTSLCPDPSRLAGLPRSAAAPRVTIESLLERRRRFIGPSLSVAYRLPVAVARGHGTYLYDPDGRRFLDTVNNVAHVGHAHPHVADAAARTMRVLATNTRYLYEQLAAYAERLTATLPEPLSVCYLVNSGSEANDLALRMARAHTGREDVVVLEGAYHGHLTSLIGLSPYKFFGEGGSGRPPGTHVAPMPDRLRGPFRGADAGERYAREVGRAADRAPGGVAAFLVEPAMGCGGQVFFPDGYLPRAFRSIRERGGLCIADEVQTGFGRMGRSFWAFQLQDVVPDILTMGKPIGNGYPLGAVVTTPEIARSFTDGMEYFNTFGGNTVACAVGMAVLDVLEQEDLQRRALETGDHFIAALERLADRHAVIGDVRGSGLFIGVELVRDRSELEPAPEIAAYVVERMRERDILTSLDGPDRNVIKIKPPLVIGRADVDRYAESLNEILAEDFVQAHARG